MSYYRRCESNCLHGRLRDGWQHHIEEHRSYYHDDQHLFVGNSRSFEIVEPVEGSCEPDDMGADYLMVGKKLSLS